MTRCRMLSVSYVGRSRRQRWPTRSPVLSTLIGKSRRQKNVSIGNGNSLRA
jgi:hypothetical protein